MQMLLTVLAAGYGALAGLLVPRVVHRLAVEPEEEWRTVCPEGHPLSGPARGWIGLARCTTPVGTASAAPPVGLWFAQPPVGAPESAVHWYGPMGVAAPAVTAAVCAALAAAVGVRPELAVWLLLTPVAVVLALVDGAVQRLPDVLTLPLAAAAAVLLGLAAVLPGHAGSWPRALLGGLALAACYAVLFLMHPNGMGFGDVKLALGLGTALGWYGWTVLFSGAFAGFLFGSLYGVGLLLLGRAGRKSALPFGPFMILGAFLGLLLGGAGTS
ncbi:prepilin peptidase [Streptomyces sp. 8N706]|uniref:prepilin peptidase n=1 Tax=Streptomyces sp. 8N706 TaxID=3457416 RepID=UPI003FD37604